MSTTQAPAAKHRSSRSVTDMLWSLLVVGAIVAAIIVVNYRAPQDPVKQIDPYPIAIQVAAVAGFPVLMPTDENWRPTAARWETTEESEPHEVWFAGGVYSDQGPFASVSQSASASEMYIGDQTGHGDPTGSSVTIAEVAWQRYASGSNRSLVAAGPTGSTIVNGTGSWEDVERFAASLRVVGPGQSQDAG